MSIMSWIDLAFCVRLVVTLGHFLWQAAAIAVLAWLARALLSEATSRLRYGVLVSALLVMAACPVVTYVFVDGSTVPSSPAGPVTMGGPPPPPLPAIAPSAANDTVSQMNVEPPETASAGQGNRAGAGKVLPAQRPVEASYGAWRALAPWLTVLYFAGVLGMLVHLLLALHGGRRLGLTSEPAGDAGLLATTAARAKAMGLRVTPVVTYCRRVVVPTVVGILRPMILLPASLATALTTEQVEAILTHELAHIRRYDHLVNLLQRVIESALFFHPAVWCVSRLIRTERENCCDDLAVAIGGERYVYASSLVRVGEICLRQKNAAGLAGTATLAAADRPCRLRRRIVRLFGGGTAHERVRLLQDWPMALVLPVFIIMAALLFVSANARPPGPLTSVDPPATQPAADKIAPAAATLEKWLAGKEVVQVRFLGPHMKPRKLLDSLKIKAADNDRTFRMMAGEMATGYSYVKVCMRVSPENTRKLLSIQKQLRATRHRMTPANTRVWALAGDPNARTKAREMAPKVLAAAANSIRTALPNAQTKPERPRGEWRLAGVTCKAPGLTKTVYIRIHEITAMMKWNFDPSFAEQTIHLPRLGLVVTTYRIPNDVLPPAREAIRKAVNQAVAPLLKLEGNTVRRREEMLPPADRLQVRLALLEQAERKGPLWPEARLYVRNAGSRTINLPRRNHTGRKMKSVFWNVGLSIEVRMPDGKIRSYSFVDESDPTYWSTIRFGPRKTMHTKPIEAGQQISLGISLGDLTDSQGAKLTSLKGVHSLRPVLTATGAAGKWWLGSSSGPWIAVKIGKQPGMAGKMPVFFTPAGGKPAAATQPAKAFKASFKTLTVEITSTWTWNRTITVKGDGSYTFHPHNSQRLKKAPGMKPLEADPNRYVATYRIGPAHLRQLDKLLGATGWLTRGGKVEPYLKDRTHYALDLTRGGKTITTTCYGDQEQAYADLILFLRRISNQEWLLYQLGKDAGYRFKPAHTIGLQLDAAVAKPGLRKPHDPVLDFHRFRPPLAAWLAAPVGRKSIELITAAKLMGYLKIQSQRKALEALAANRTIREPRVRQAALRALAQLDGSASIPAPATRPANGAKALKEFLDRVQRVKRGNGWVERKRHTRNDAGQITGLKLKEAKLEKNDFVVIGALQYLETLELTRTTVTNDDLKHLAGLKKLRVLKLDWNRAVGDAGVAHLGKLTGLETLDLRLTKVTGKGLATLIGLKNLRHLDVNDSPVDDVGLKHISQLARLEVLNIGGTKITDKGLHHLKGLKHLRGLTLEETGITNKGLNYLAKFPRFFWISSPVNAAQEFVRRLENGDFTAVGYMYSPSIYMPTRGKMTNARLTPLPLNAKDRKFNQLRFRVEMHWTVPPERIDTTLFGTFAVDRGAIRMHRVGIDE